MLLSLPVTAAQTAAGDIYLMGELPEDCALVDAVFAATDLDTGTPAHAMSFGVINDDETDLATALQAALTVGQAGTAARLTPTVTTLTTKTDGKTRKKLGYKVTTASATGAAGTVYLSLSYRSLTGGA
ncbi:MAG: hypothetical protein MZV65_39370 [Chromatiales bacterium]|nr:hypothetical protein [Chromatiales bacterium]MCK7581096.1 hypothetical protein [Chromatiales bacterium]